MTHSIPTAKMDRTAVEGYGWLMALAAGLSAILIAVKLTLLPFPVETPSEFGRWCLRLGLVASADVMYAFGLAGVAALAWRFARVRPFVARWTRPAVVVAFQLSAVYGIVSLPMFRMTMVPLTVQILSFSGGPGLMGSSVAAFATPVLIAAVAGVPLLLLAVLWLVRTMRLPPLQGLRGGRGVFAAVALCVVCTGTAHAYIRSQWTDINRWERRIAANPHAVFLASCVEELFKSDRLAFSLDLADADESDFVRSDIANDDREFKVARPRPLHTREGRGDRPAAPRNLVVVVLESVGAEYLGLYGAAHDTTPNLARLVEQGGIVFDATYAHAPSSPKGLVALTCGVYPGIDWKLITRDAPGFDVPALPQVLADAGYRTCYVHGGYWSWKNRDRFLRERGVQNLIDADTMAAEKNEVRPFSWGFSDSTMLDAALQWIDEGSATSTHDAVDNTTPTNASDAARNATKPFHLMLWTIETHHPYIAGNASIDFHVKDPELGRYLNAIRNADALIGRLHEELDRRGLVESTLIAVTGDHGEAFGQHGQRVHSFGIYQENVRVPLVLLHPSLPRGEHIREPVQQIDIPATLLGLLGKDDRRLSLPAEWQGRDVLRDGPAPRSYFYSTGNEVMLGLREGSLKYHYYVSSGAEELFDLTADPREFNNLAANQRETCERFRRHVAGLVRYQRKFLAEHNAP